MLKPGTIELDMSAFGKHLEVATIGDKLRETRLKIFGQVQRNLAIAPFKKSFSI